MFITVKDSQGSEHIINSEEITRISCNTVVMKDGSIVELAESKTHFKRLVKMLKESTTEQQQPVVVNIQELGEVTRSFGALIEAVERMGEKIWSSAVLINNQLVSKAKTAKEDEALACRRKQVSETFLSFSGD